VDKDIVRVAINKAELFILQGDITLQDTDAIVNAANSGLMGGGGVDGAIHRAGGSAILEACKEIVAKQGRLPAGQAVITIGGNLKARHVIHTVGPIWNGGERGEPKLLESAYLESLKTAAVNNLKSVAFPSISTGAYLYPLGEASRLALKAVISFLEDAESSVKEVIFVLFDARTYDAYMSALHDLTSDR